jgi:DNA repair protein RadD
VGASEAAKPAAGEARGLLECCSELGGLNTSNAKLPAPKNQTAVLRPYQTAAVEGVRRAYGSGAESVVFVLPTGGGKTVIFVVIVDNAVALGRRVLILAHRQEIVDQISAALTLAGIGHGLIAPGHPETEDLVQLASVASLARPRRRERWSGKFDFVVIDECHHAVSPT